MEAIFRNFGQFLPLDFGGVAVDNRGVLILNGPNCGYSTPFREGSFGRLFNDS
jgi:hypothetical protein